MMWILTPYDALLSVLGMDISVNIVTFKCVSHYVKKYLNSSPTLHTSPPQKNTVQSGRFSTQRYKRASLYFYTALNPETDRQSVAGDARLQIYSKKDADLKSLRKKDKSSSDFTSPSDFSLVTIHFIPENKVRL